MENYRIGTPYGEIIRRQSDDDRRDNDDDGRFDDYRRRYEDERRRFPRRNFEDCICRCRDRD